VSTELEAQALNFKNQENDVYSCSWGPEDTGTELGGPGPIVRDALLEGVTNGRHGLGNIFVVASGNGGVNDGCNYDGYANSIYTLTVSAIDRDGNIPLYAEGCNAVITAGFSSDYSNDIVSFPFCPKISKAQYIKVISLQQFRMSIMYLLQAKHYVRKRMEVLLRLHLKELRWLLLY